MVVLIVIIVLILGVYLSQYNSIKSLQNKISQSRSGIDVQLEKRFDLIPNLIECVKGYCEHEEKLLNELTEARSSYLKSKTIQDGELAENKTNQVLLLAERYPDLKASSNFLELQASLERTESSLAAARRLYNSDVNLYNTKIETFPGNLVAGLMGAKKEVPFEAEEAAKSNVKVQI